MQIDIFAARQYLKKFYDIDMKMTEKVSCVKVHNRIKEHVKREEHISYGLQDLKACVDNAIKVDVVYDYRGNARLFVKENYNGTGKGK